MELYVFSYLLKAKFFQLSICLCLFWALLSSCSCKKMRMKYFQNIQTEELFMRKTSSRCRHNWLLFEFFQAKFLFLEFIQIKAIFLSRYFFFPRPVSCMRSYAQIRKPEDKRKNKDLLEKIKLLKKILWERMCMKYKD